jgi:hypothetical protein
VSDIQLVFIRKSYVTTIVDTYSLLVRTEDENVRKQMLRQKLILSQDDEAVGVVGSKVGEALPTSSPQCEHIVVEAVKSWGGKDVRPKELEDTITDVLAQVNSFESLSNHILVEIT